jgi:outer membrane protein OmpA-like peptidoglycan-associated protein
MSLNIRITGAADDYTGTNHRNNILSKQRAGYIAYLLTKNGVRSDRISRDAEGGIKYYSLVHANRFARVELFK